MENQQFEDFWAKRSSCWSQISFRKFMFNSTKFVHLLNKDNKQRKSSVNLMYRWSKRSFLCRNPEFFNLSETFYSPHHKPQDRFCTQVKHKWIHSICCHSLSLSLNPNERMVMGPDCFHSRLLLVDLGYKNKRCASVMLLKEAYPLLHVFICQGTETHLKVALSHASLWRNVKYSTPALPCIF